VEGVRVLKNDDTVVLKDGDCALIIRADGSQELIIPELPDEAYAPDNAMDIMRCVCFLNDEILSDARDRVEAVMRKRADALRSLQ